MIQAHGKTILSMEFTSMIKAHDLNPWQFIYPKLNSHLQHQSLILIDNIKTPFSLVISKVQLILALLKAQTNYLALFYQKSSRLLTLGKEKIYHGIIVAQILL